MICVSRAPSPQIGSGSVGTSIASVVTARGESGCTASTACATIGRRSSADRFKGDLAQRDARDVQQVIDQARELRGLPGDDVARPDDRLVAPVPAAA